MNQLTLIFCFLPFFMLAQTPENQIQTHIYNLGTASIKIVVYEKNNGIIG